MNSQRPSESLPALRPEAKAKKEYGLASSAWIRDREQIVCDLCPFDPGELGVGQSQPFGHGLSVTDSFIKFHIYNLAPDTRHANLIHFHGMSQLAIGSAYDHKNHF